MAESPSSIGSLALALSYLRAPDLNFMVMTAFFDESGTHGRESPATIFTGVASTAHLWYIFEQELRDMLKKHSIDKFHAKDFNNRNRAFKNLSFDEYARFNSSFLQLIDKCVVRGVVIVLPSDPYREIYRPRFFRKKSRPDSEYGLCFRAAILKYALALPDDAFPLVPILERGHRNATDALRIYNELKSRLDEDRREFLGPISFADKRSCLPLAAADSIAYGMFRHVSGRTSHKHPNVVPSGPAIPSYLAGAIPGKAQITRIELSESDLDYLSSDLR